MTNYLLYNGSLLKTQNFSLGVDNRAFRFGDGLFETMRAVNQNVLFLDDHLARLRQGMHLLAYEDADTFSATGVAAWVSLLLQKNNISNARLRLSVFRKPGGLYTPSSMAADFVLEAWPLAQALFTPNPKAINLCLFRDYPKAINALGAFKSLHTQLYMLAGIYAQRHKKDDALLLNEKGNVCEATSSNVFIVRENTLITPPETSGCVQGIMRKQVLRLAAKQFVVQQRAVQPKELLLADEVFLTNAARGIIPVAQYEHKQFSTNKSTQLIGLLNKHLLQAQ